MTYTPTTWNTGDVITAAGLNNLESQFTNSTPELFVKYSTASTGTAVLSITSTINIGPTIARIAVVYVPPYVQRSRLELYCQAYSVSTTGGNNFLYLYKNNSTLTSLSIVSTTYAADSDAFDCRGGDLLEIYGVCPPAAGYFRNITISGTTTIVSTPVIDASFFPYSLTGPGGIGSSTGA